jgi:hypothetical protein
MYQTLLVHRYCRRATARSHGDSLIPNSDPDFDTSRATSMTSLSLLSLPLHLDEFVTPPPYDTLPVAGARFEW